PRHPRRRWPLTRPSSRRSGGRSAAGPRTALLNLVFVGEERIGRITPPMALVERHGDQLDAVALDLEDVEAHPVELDVVARLCDATELAEDESGDRVEVLLGELGAEALV